MEYTPYSLLVDVGWISMLLVVGNILRNRVRIFQQLLLPASMTAGLLGLIMGPEVLGWLGFSEHMGTYTTLLIAVVFASMAYSMDLNPNMNRALAICGVTQRECSWLNGACSSF